MSLQETMVGYLEAKGWYFDWDHVNANLTWYAGRDREQIVREAHAWTVPQWGEYWSSDHLDPVGPKPKTRRHERLQDALWSQLLREEEPETYEVFYKVLVLGP